MARVELRIFPPLSHEMFNHKVGVHISEQEISPPEALGDLLARLAQGSNGAWLNIFDSQTRQIRPGLVIILNKRILSPFVAAQTPLSSGDRISLNYLVVGG